jgi:large subunit ribosomal protein L5
MAEKQDKTKQTKAATKAAGKPAAPAKEGKKAGAKATAVAAGGVVKGVAPRLKQKYRGEVVPALMKEFEYASPMQAPKLTKIVLNVGMGEAITNAKALDAAVGELTLIAGQRPVVTRAKKSIATFKLREGMPIGASVTLRRDHMYEFLDRFISAALPRIRDFKGVSPKSFDGRGNYSIGVKEQVIFPEIEIDKIDSVHGLDITFVTTARTDEEGRALLTHLGMPFRK